jgi:hypothetical protein
MLLTAHARAQITFDFPFVIPPCAPQRPQRAPRHAAGPAGAARARAAARRYFALIIRAISVLEGIALVGDPSFAIVDGALPREIVMGL